MSGKEKFTLNGKNVIVTGASGGLGKAMTFRLIAAYGCRVLGVSRSADKLLAVKEQLGEKGDCFQFLALDVSARGSWQELADYVRTGGFDADVLINNAGMLPGFAKFGRYSADEIDRCMALNLDAVLWAAEAFIPLLEKKPGAALINIASADALCALAGTSLYSASKAAVKALSEAMREEYRGRIYIPAVCPGFIRTDIMSHQKNAVSPLIGKVSMPVEKAARVLLRRANAGRSRIVFGFDAHFMSAAYRIAPVLSLRFFRWFFRVSGVEVFKDIF